MSEETNPFKRLAFAGRDAERNGHHDIAFALHRAARLAMSLLVEGAATEVELDSWTDFETWFSRNRAQGLEFVFADKYGEDAPQTVKVKSLLAGYDVLERELHDLYLMLKEESAPAPVTGPAPVEDTPTTIEDITSEDTGSDEPALDEISLDEEVAADEEEEATDEEETEELDEEEELADEVLSPEASTGNDIPQMKTVKRIQSLMRKANINVTDVTFRGLDKHGYRIKCANDAAAEQAMSFFTKASWDPKRFDHVSGRIYVDVTPVGA